MKKYNLTVIFVLFTFFVFAQDEADHYAKLKGYNTDYRVNYFDKIIGQLEFNTELENFYIPRLFSNQEANVSIVPNQVLKMKFSIDYKFLGLNFAISPSFLPGNKYNPQKGNTETLDFSFKFFYSDKLRQEVTFKKIKGFYLEDFNTGETLEILPTLEISTYGGKTFYIINKNFSYRSFETMTERQIKSNGSLVPSISYYYSELQNDQNYVSNSNLAKIKSFDFNFQTGYMHNFVYKKRWFTTLGFHPGIGFNKSSNYYLSLTDTDPIKTSTLNVNFNIDLNIALGYNNKNLFIGLRSNFRNSNLNDNSNKIQNNRTSFGIYTGYRFNEKKSIKKAFQFIERKLKL